jgi:sugar lactone lactonase YvrE
MIDPVGLMDYAEGMSAKVVCAVDAKARLGEGPVWSQARGLLYWVDIEGGLVHSYEPASGATWSFEVGMRVGAVVARKDSAGGGLLLATERGFVSLDEKTGEVKLITDPEADKHDTRFNDGKCDPAGRFWAGTMSCSRTRGAANLWCMDTDYSVTQRVTGVTVSNGITWSLDQKKMYYIDSSEFAVVSFQYDRDSGAISDPEPVITVARGLGKPDGMCIDSEGNLWIALFRGGAVSKWDPEKGELLELFEIPAVHVTACAFGGEDLSTLFVTTARGPASREELEVHPQAGGLFALKPGVTGAPSFEFGP